MTDHLAPFTLGERAEDLKEVVRTRIQAAIDAFEQSTSEEQALSAEALDANTLLFQGEYEKVVQLYERSGEHEKWGRGGCTV
ncbi:MAG TPA: hypothetical protein VF618_23205 [Thermoanaerobaculia bacterium]